MSLPSNPALHVVLADRHPVVREGVRSLIQSRFQPVMIHEAGTVREALLVLERVPAALLVSGVDLEGGGLELVRQVRKRWPNVRVLILSSLSETVHAERGLAAGALGYVAKDQPLGLIGEAIETVLEGRVYVTPRVRRHFIQKLAAASESESPLDQLTDRELDVFEHLGRGMTRSQIAVELALSPKTIDSYRMRIQLKLGLESAAMLRRVAAQSLADSTADSDPPQAAENETSDGADEHAPGETGPAPGS